MPSKTWYLPIAFILLAFASLAAAQSDAYKENLFNPGKLKPIDSTLKVKVGQPAPDFDLLSIAHGRVALSSYRGKKNVVLSFVPAAWTPVCSDQWPGYGIVKPLFEENNAILLGISVDNLPTLHAWTGQMGKLWFPVLSDFWPHGAVAQQYGLLRTDGTAERALIFIDQKGIIRHIHVSDINVRPKLELIVDELTRIHQNP
jgi:peroxiredoxin (alkyl hydroperoxide reductase subunit C)